MEVHQAVEFANQVASITVSHMGAQPSLPDLQAVNNRLNAAGRAELVWDV